MTATSSVDSGVKYINAIETVLLFNGLLQSPG
jgi:hypothetical protein